MKNIFLEKLYTECDRKLFQNRFLQNENWPYLQINSLKIYTVCFYYMSSGGVSDIETELQTVYFYLVLFYLLLPCKLF